MHWGQRDFLLHRLPINIISLCVARIASPDLYIICIGYIACGLTHLECPKRFNIFIARLIICTRTRVYSRYAEKNCRKRERKREIVYEVVYTLGVISS